VTLMTKAYLVLGVGVVSVSVAALLIRLADAPPLVIAAYRLCLASLVLVPIAIGRSRGQWRRLTGREIGLLLAAGACLALHFGLWITSLRYTSVATSVVLVTASPVFLAIASRFLFGQRLGLLAVAGIAMSLAGGLLVSYGNWRLGSRPLEGSLLAAGGALAVSGYLIIGQMLRRSLSVLGYVTVVYGSAGLLLLLATLVLGYSLSGYSAGTYAALGLLAAVPQLIGHSSLNWALRFVPATVVAIAVLGEPVGAAVWAYLFLREAPSASELAGGALILSGIFLAMRGMASPGVSGPVSTPV
jgi:drug/metabolite transporter (DMT)-like permease